jgi:trk system potassium uptake protein TrkA
VSRFAVIGLGSFGTSLARNLTRLGGKVTAIDHDMGLVEAIKDEVHTAIRLDARDRDALEERGVHEVDAAVVCMGEDFEAAEICAVYLTELGCPKVLVRGTTHERAEILKALVPGVIQPGIEAARELSARLLGPGVVAYACLMGVLDVAVVEVPAAAANEEIASLALPSRTGARVLALLPDGRSEDVVVGPPETRVLAEGDLLYLLGEERSLIRAARRIAGTLA